MIKREKTRKNPKKKWRLASLAASGGGGGSAALGRGVGGSTPHPPYWRCLLKTVPKTNDRLSIILSIELHSSNMQIMI